MIAGDDRYQLRSKETKYVHLNAKITLKLSSIQFHGWAQYYNGGRIETLCRNGKTEPRAARRRAAVCVAFHVLTAVEERAVGQFRAVAAFRCRIVRKKSVFRVF